uniref:Uncharacterized protein n=1 Tax=Arundo donax TaxID=35708 RepID=A0A0A8Y7K9_ARUDO
MEDIFPFFFFFVDLFLVFCSL